MVSEETFNEKFDSIEETFNEKFETVQEALKYISDSQAHSEWVRKKEEFARRARQSEFEEEHKLRQESIDRNLDSITNRLNHIGKLTGIVFDDLDFQNEKLKVAGNALTRQNPSIERKN